MLRPPPRSTLFPSRRSSDLQRTTGPTLLALTRQVLPNLNDIPVQTRREGVFKGARSEEHTSELQSRRDLVCRLLLEKKKKNSNERSNERPTAATEGLLPRAA